MFFLAVVILSEFVAAESLAFFVFAGALLLEGTLLPLLLFAIEV
jgi:hypothetical protein